MNFFNDFDHPYFRNKSEVISYLLNSSLDRNLVTGVDCHAFDFNGFRRLCAIPLEYVPEFVGGIAVVNDMLQ